MEGLEPCRNDPVRQGSFAESGRDATRATVQMLAPRRRNHPGVSRRRLAAERQMPIGALGHAANASIEDVLAEGSTWTWRDGPNNSQPMTAGPALCYCIGQSMGGPVQREGHRKAGEWEVAMRSGVLFAAMLAASSVSADEPPLTIGQLLGQGWEIAGYASGYDNRSSLILFRKPGTNALVQCSAMYDVTRSPRTVVNCYELR
jgi:hypothetical protein